MSSEFYSHRHLKSLSLYGKLKFIDENATPLKVGYATKTIEAELYSYNGFYIEVFVERYTNKVLEVKLFKSARRLKPYLPQIDINEITALLSCS